MATNRPESTPAHSHALYGLAVAALVLVSVLGLDVGRVGAQSIDITFRYHAQPGQTISKAYLRGDFNGWSAGPNEEMQFDGVLGAWIKVQPLPPGTTEYKFYLESPAGNIWLPDPLNPYTNPNDNNNSVLTVTDPMLFEVYLERAETGSFLGVTAGIFGSRPFAEVTVDLNGVSVDGLPFFDAASGILRYPFPNPVDGSATITITARDDMGREASQQFTFFQPEVIDAARPSETMDGINYGSDDTRVRLSLFAPGKKWVAVIGDFNDWQVDASSVMKRDSLSADSVYYWIDVEGLTPGVEYAFQYLIDGQMRVADPFAEKILDPAFDGALASIYPGLKPYPHGKTTEIASVLQTATTEYEWKSTNFVRPPQHELVIYEMLVRDFLDRHDYATLIDSLDYLQTLGINAIELMPVSEFDGNGKQSWGYDPAFHLAPDKAYGPSSDLKRFVDACHERDIAVILDVVYNHVTGNAPFLRMYNQSPSGTPGAPALPDNPWVNTVARHPFNVHNDVNHESEPTQYWLDRANAFWLTEYRVDGFRFDLTKGFTQVDYGGDVGRWSGYDASRVRLLKRMVDEIWEIDPSAYVIFEHLGANREEKEYAEYRVNEGLPGILLWGKANAEYNEATMGYHDGGKSDFAGIYFGKRGWSEPNLIGYMESHDEQWLMFKNRMFAACENAPLGGNRCQTDPGSYNIRDLPVALDRMKMAGAFFFTIPGPKMMFQFGELGYGWGPGECLRPDNGVLGDCPPGNPERTGPKPVRWDYFRDPLRRKLYDTWASLIDLRRNHRVFHSPTTEVVLDTRNAVKRILLSNADMNVSIIGNFGVREDTGFPDFHHTGIWYDFFSGDSLNVTDPAVAMELAPGQFHVYTNKRVELPASDLITVARDADLLPTKHAFGLDVYPNPLARNATLSFRLERKAMVEILVYDMLGRQVAVLERGYRPAGLQRVVMTNQDLAPGVYLLNAIAGRERASRLIHVIGS